LGSAIPSRLILRIKPLSDNEKISIHIMHVDREAETERDQSGAGFGPRRCRGATVLVALCPVVLI
jgi:hypothetical protein